MIIKLPVDVLQMIQKGPPVFIWVLNLLDFLGVHVGFGGLKSWLLHSEESAVVRPIDGGTSANVSLVYLRDFLQVKNIWLGYSS